MSKIPKLIIFDRDDTLIKNKQGHLHDIDDLEWFPGAEETLKLIHSKNIFIAVATNQGGIAKGLYEAEEVENFHMAMNNSDMVKGAINLFVYCPHHPEGIIANLSVVCECRKPGPGMLMEILNHFGVKANESVFFGDAQSDVIAGKSAGVETILVSPGSIQAEVLKRIPHL